MTEMTTVGREHEAYQAVEHELGVLFRRARALSTEVAREVHPELEPAAYGLLIGMHDCARSRPSDLADYFGVGKATISRQVKGLEELGLIERRPDPDDGRAHLLVLTEEGRRRVETARTARQERFHAMLGTWPAEDVRVLGRMLARFNDLTESKAGHL
ncbi:MarR family winged helix-turn-helix transcriptional regulator [Actinoallomurus iriomotensis]|jgi:DNA-binding MarR family transcriptional regulator|uniref:Transcriptional regulator n=1 Tax=Actinoallomurus iriomotensis TaxID=478107 RepID=A0A9W6VQG6_9ACTN|nr:MarR family transcriptional regulator [Actinoallomurus iriomotensis]GLY81083.1 transcriptional regulator [Actinoallomurus iriomotensis]GLY86422.1 transcriptional regulator [Actinoallomurus iriomotensis]